jgi:hypothetical protein
MDSKHLEEHIQTGLELLIQTGLERFKARLSVNRSGTPREVPEARFKK